jgi:hypothetical protein
MASYKKLRYRGLIFYLVETCFKSFNGYRYKNNGIVFIAINSDLTVAEKSRTLHGLIKGKNLCNFHGIPVRSVI